jgi:hypothetical protein
MAFFMPGGQLFSYCGNTGKLCHFSAQIQEYYNINVPAENNRHKVK